MTKSKQYLISVLASAIIFSSCLNATNNDNLSKDDSTRQAEQENKIDTALWQKNEDGSFRKKTQPCNVKDNGLKAFDKINFCISAEDFDCMLNKYQLMIGNCSCGYYANFKNDSLSELSLYIPKRITSRNKISIEDILHPNIEECRITIIDLIKSIYGLPQAEKGKLRWENNYKIIILSDEVGIDKEKELVLKFLYKPFVARNEIKKKALNKLEINKF